MPTWWGKSSSKEAKRKTARENLIGTIYRIISPIEQSACVKTGAFGRHNSDLTSQRGSLSRAGSRSNSPSTQVSRCQSFVDRPHAQPLPLPSLDPGIVRTPSAVGVPKSIVGRRGKPQLLLPLPKPGHIPRRPNTNDTDVDFGTASVSSNCSGDSDDPMDSRLQSPAGNDCDNGSRVVTSNNSSISKRKQSPICSGKMTKDASVYSNCQLHNHTISTPSKVGISSNQPPNLHLSRHCVLASAPDSSLSSPSRSPIRMVCPEQIPTSAFWVAKPHGDMNVLGSGQCSSPGSGQTSGHNSMGGDLSGQLFWQHSRGSPECSPIPSPRMTSPGPSSRIHSGTVSPLHPRAGGTASESPSSRPDEPRKQSHRLPLPPINISNISAFSLINSVSNTPSPLPRSPGKTENPVSPGSRWKKGRLLGQGTFGHVYVGFNSDSGEMCAMKEVTLFSDDAKSRESAKQLGQEISLLSRLRHPNIVQYYGCDMIDDKLYIYLEYVSGGSIHKLLQEYGQLGELAIRSYTQQILSGLAYLHAKNTVHRDIKGANILVDPSGRVKLADFGMAKHISGQSCPLSFKGSPYWMAPEVIKNSSGCNLAVDIWSLGCTVLEMATSKPPWSQYEGIAAMFKIGNSKELPAIPDNLSDECKDFIMKCLQREPSNRPTAAALLQHPFVRTFPLERPSPYAETSEQLSGASDGQSFKGPGHYRNLPSVGVDGFMIQQLRSCRTSPMVGDATTRNISCPVSPVGSPLLSSRSLQKINGRISPSPMSSPRTSGSSTPLTGGNGAIPYNQINQFACLQEGFSSSPRSPNNPSPRLTNPDVKIDLYHKMHQSFPLPREHVISETDIMGLPFGWPTHCYNREFHERQHVSAEPVSYQHLREHVQSIPSLDLTPDSSLLGRTNDS